MGGKIVIPVVGDPTQFNQTMAQAKNEVATLNNESKKLRAEVMMTFSNGRQFASLLAMNFKNNQLGQAFIAAQQTLSLGISIKSTAQEIAKAQALAMGGQASQWITVGMLTGIMASQVALRTAAMRAQKEAERASHRAELLRLFTEAYR